jgi:hypothetical protein
MSTDGKQINVHAVVSVCIIVFVPSTVTVGGTGSAPMDKLDSAASGAASIDLSDQEFFSILDLQPSDVVLSDQDFFEILGVPE